MKTGSLVLMTGLLAACASSSPIRWAPPSDFALAITDNPSSQHFDLSLTSKANTALCLSKESWPTESGLPLGFDGAQLKTSNGVKELLATGSAYCPGGCGYIRIEPRQRLRGLIPYSAFGDEKNITSDLNRRLIFEVHPFICHD